MPLAAFFAAPTFGRYGNHFGVKNIYNCGALVQGIVTVCLGSLLYIKDVSTFLALSYTLRFVILLPNSNNAKTIRNKTFPDLLMALH